MNSMTSNNLPPTLFQAAALYRVYNRLALNSINLLSIIIIAPLAIRFVWFLIDLASNKMTFFTLLMTFVLSTSVYLMVFRWSTSKEALERWLDKYERRIPSYALASSLVLARIIGGITGMQDLLTVNPKSMLPSLQDSLYLALAVALLQAAIVLRYISPISIMRFSVMPLLMNPLEQHFLELWLRPWTVVEPSDAGQDDLLLKRDTSRGRRFFHPSFYNMLWQLLVSLTAGAGVGITVLHYIPSYLSAQSLQLNVILVSCALTVACTLPMPPLHELEYKRCHELGGVLWSRFNWSGAFRRAVAVPISVILVAKLFYNAHMGLQNGALLLFFLIASCLVIHGAAAALDGWIKLELSRPLDIKQSIDGICSEPSAIANVDAIVTSLVFDSVIAKEVRDERPEAQSDFRVESTRCARLSQALANNLTTTPGEYTEAPFEEDAFRMAILESLSGSRQISANDWLAPQPRSRNDALIVVLVRALCVLLGGLGECLTLISSPSTSPRKRLNKVGDFWFLAPSFVTCAEFALQALARYITLSMNSKGQILDWRGYQVAVLVPAALHAVFALRKGLIAFEKHQRSEGITADAIAPDLEALARSCDLTARRILDCLKSPSTEDRLDLFLTEDCELWVRSLAKPLTPLKLIC